MNGYAQIADMMARYPNRDLVQLTNEDPTSKSIDTTFLQTYLDDAADEIDTYLESRFALPLQNPPSILTRICCELAMYHLQTLRPIHDGSWIKDNYEKNCKFLNEVSEGQLTLGLNTASGTEPADPSSPAVVFVDAGGVDTGTIGAPGTEAALGDNVGPLPHRVFSRGKLIGF